MGRPPNPLNVPLDMLPTMVENAQGKFATLAQMEAAACLASAVLKDEISQSMSALVWVQFLSKHVLEETFDYESYNGWMSREAGAVLVPAYVIHAIAAAMEDYLDAEAGTSLGKAFQEHFDGRSARETVATSRWHIELAYAVFNRKLAAEVEGRPTGDRNAAAEVADNYADDGVTVSEDTVHRSYLRWGKLIRAMHGSGYDPAEVF